MNSSRRGPFWETGRLMPAKRPAERGGKNGRKGAKRDERHAVGKRKKFPPEGKTADVVGDRGSKAKKKKKKRISKGGQ